MFGLIPYCLENPRLHIQRRVNVWRVVLPAGEPGDVYQWAAKDRATLRRFRSVMHHDHMCGAFKVGIEGAVAVAASGMPTNS